MSDLFILAAAEGGIAGTAAEIGRTFGFNWQLFLSQIVSFVIVALLLAKFAFKPILTVLDERRSKIAESLANAEKIKQQLADAEAKHQEILTRANQEAQKLVEEARTNIAAFSEKQRQQAVTDAEGIVAKAREAATHERDRMFNELRGELGRLVVSTTAKVAGKVLTPEDQKRLAEEAIRSAA
mgnify:CR=1 FL=1